MSKRSEARYTARAIASRSLPDAMENSAARTDQGLTLLTNEIHDEAWVAAFDHGIDQLMLGFSNYDAHGSDHRLIRAALVADMDGQVLLDTIGREFTHRLRREIERGAGIELDLRYSEMDLSMAGAMHFLSLTMGRGDAAAIYDWSMRQTARPGSIKPSGPWQWGLWLDRIVRSIGRTEGSGSGIYASLFRDMCFDGFIVKAMVLELKHPTVFGRELGFQDCTMH